MKTNRTLSLLLALLMLTPTFMSCGEQEASDPSAQATTAEETTAETVPEETAPETEARLTSTTVPADMDLNGAEVAMLHFTDSGVPSYNIMIAEQNGELLNDSTYTANQVVMENLNCTFKHYDNGGIEPTELTNLHAAGDDLYDLVYGTQWKVAPLVSRGIFANLNESADNYLDYDQPWWYTDYIGETTVDNTHTYFLAGDASPDIFRRSSMMVLNTDLLTDIGEKVDTVYDSVLEGTWTYDKLSSLVSLVYTDNNGDGKKNVGDSFGFATWSRSDIDHLFGGSGVRACTKDETGMPTITFNNETTLKAIEAIYNLFWTNPGSYYVEQIDVYGMLERSEVLFLCLKFGNLDKTREIETGFTVLPIPKVDESIPSYHSLVHDDALILSVPSMNTDVKTTTAVIESLGCQYYNDVMPQYYEVILKTKYRRDSSDAAAQIIDIVHDGMTTDFMYIYNYALSACYLNNSRELIGSQKSMDFASNYKKTEKQVNKLMEKLIASIKGE